MVIHYTNYQPYLREMFAGFGKENASARMTFNLALNMGQKMRCRDTSEIFWMFLSQDIGNNRGTIRTFRKMLDKYPLFICTDERYMSGKMAKKYVPTELFADLLCLANNGGEKPKMVEIVNGRIHPLKRRRTQKAVFDYENTCKINIERVECLYRKCRENGWESDAVDCASILYHSDSGGFLSQQYKRYPCGRLFNMSQASVQNIKKFIREEMFSGYYLTDASNCHYMLATKYTDHIAITEYATEPNRVRKLIADQTGATVEEVKKGLLQLLYGASANFEDVRNPMTKLMGKERAEKFFNHPKVQKIHAGIRQLTNDIIKARGYFGDLSDHKLRYHWLTQDESVMLDCAVELCDDVQGLYFDGIISETPLDVIRLQGVVKEKLGIDVFFTSKKIGSEI